MAVSLKESRETNALSLHSCDGPRLAGCNQGLGWAASCLSVITAPGMSCRGVALRDSFLFQVGGEARANWRAVTSVFLFGVCFFEEILVKRIKACGHTLFSHASVKIRSNPPKKKTLVVTIERPVGLCPMIFTASHG